MGKSTTKRRAVPSGSVRPVSPKTKKTEPPAPLPEGMMGDLPPLIAEGPPAKKAVSRKAPANRIAEHVTPEPPAPDEYNPDEVREMSREKNDHRIEVRRRRQPFVSYVLDIERTMSSRRDMTLEDFIQEEIEDFRAEDGEHVAIWRGTEILAVVRPAPDGRAEVIRLDADDLARWSFAEAEREDLFEDQESGPRILKSPRPGGRLRTFDLRDCDSLVGTYQGVGLTVADIAAQKPYPYDEDDKGPIRLEYTVHERHHMVGVIILRSYRPTLFIDLENPSAYGPRATAPAIGFKRTAPADLFAERAGGASSLLKVPRPGGRLRTLNVLNGAGGGMDTYQGVGLTVADIASDPSWIGENPDPRAKSMDFAVFEDDHLVGGIRVLDGETGVAYVDLDDPADRPLARDGRQAIPLEINRISYGAPVTPGRVVRKSMTFHLEDRDAAPITIQAIVMGELTAREHEDNLAGLVPELGEAGWSRDNILGNEIFTRLIV